MRFINSFILIFLVFCGAVVGSGDAGQWKISGRVYSLNESLPADTITVDLYKGNYIMHSIQVVGQYEFDVPSGGGYIVRANRTKGYVQMEAQTLQVVNSDIVYDITVFKPFDSGCNGYLRSPGYELYVTYGRMDLNHYICGPDQEAACNALPIYLYLPTYCTYSITNSILNIQFDGNLLTLPFIDRDLNSFYSDGEVEIPDLFIYTISFKSDLGNTVSLSTTLDNDDNTVNIPMNRDITLKIGGNSDYIPLWNNGKFRFTEPVIRIPMFPKTLYYITFYTTSRKTDPLLNLPLGRFTQSLLCNVSSLDFTSISGYQAKFNLAVSITTSYTSYSQSETNDWIRSLSLKSIEDIEIWQINLIIPPLRNVATHLRFPNHYSLIYPEFYVDDTKLDCQALDEYFACYIQFDRSFADVKLKWNGTDLPQSTLVLRSSMLTSIYGTVYIDYNQNNVQDPNEPYFSLSKYMNISIVPLTQGSGTTLTISPDDKSQFYTELFYGDYIMSRMELKVNPNYEYLFPVLSRNLLIQYTTGYSMQIDIPTYRLQETPFCMGKLHTEDGHVLNIRSNLGLSGMNNYVNLTTYGWCKSPLICEYPYTRVELPSGCVAKYDVQTNLLTVGFRTRFNGVDYSSLVGTSYSPVDVDSYHYHFTFLAPSPICSSSNEPVSLCKSYTQNSEKDLRQVSIGRFDTAVWSAYANGLRMELSGGASCVDSTEGRRSTIFLQCSEPPRYLASEGPLCHNSLFIHTNLSCQPLYNCEAGDLEFYGLSNQTFTIEKGDGSMYSLSLCYSPTSQPCQDGTSVCLITGDKGISLGDFGNMKWTLSPEINGATVSFTRWCQNDTKVHLTCDSETWPYYNYEIESGGCTTRHIYMGTPLACTKELAPNCQYNNFDFSPLADTTFNVTDEDHNLFYFRVCGVVPECFSDSPDAGALGQSVCRKSAAGLHGLGHLSSPSPQWNVDPAARGITVTYDGGYMCQDEELIPAKTMIHLQCDKDTRVISVMRRWPCVYYIYMTTPLACKPLKTLPSCGFQGSDYTILYNVPINNRFSSLLHHTWTKFYTSICGVNSYCEDFFPYPMSTCATRYNTTITHDKWFQHDIGQSGTNQWGSKNQLTQLGDFDVSCVQKMRKTKIKMVCVKPENNAGKSYNIYIAENLEYNQCNAELQIYTVFACE